MAKAVADVDSLDNQGGFTTEGGNITGFSGMHDSGTGGQPSLGNFPLFPYAGCAGDDINGCPYPKPDRAAPYVSASVNATPGYFGLQLQNGIRADMTVTNHTSLFRFRFPDLDAQGKAAKPVIITELGDLSLSRQDNASISVDEGGRISGSGVFLPSFGEGNYTLYFCADFQGAPVRDAGIFVNNRASTAVTNLTYAHGFTGSPIPAGGILRFERLPVNNTISVRMATSFISTDRACQYAEKEIPSFDFDATHAAALQAWHDKLAPITVSPDNVSRDMLVSFYSGVYRTLLNPQDYTGENPLWSSEEPYFDSFYW